MTVKGVCRDVSDFLRGLALDLPEVFPRPPVYCRRAPRRRARLPRPSRADHARAKELIAARAAHWAGVLGLKYNRLAVKSQRSLWGSCSRRGNLNFNWRLAAAPPETLDYVVIHELCHLLEMNHSRKFWERVAAACPDYKARRAWLRRNGAALLGVNALEPREN